MVKLLIKYGATVKFRPVGFGNVLHMVAQTGDVNMGNFLLLNGAEISFKDSLNRTALHVAAEYGKFL